MCSKQCTRLGLCLQHHLQLAGCKEGRFRSGVDVIPCCEILSDHQQSSNQASCRAAPTVQILRLLALLRRVRACQYGDHIALITHCMACNARTGQMLCVPSPPLPEKLSALALMSRDAVFWKLVSASLNADAFQSSSNLGDVMSTWSRTL